MNISPQTVSYFSVWIVNIIYTVGMIPQIRLNYKLKTASGLSDLMILGAVLGYITFCFHIFLAQTPFPLAYRVMAPIGLLATLILLGQRIYYNRIKMKGVYLISYGMLFILTLLLIAISMVYQKLVADICGWVYFSVWLVYMIPQGVKMYLAKSVKGFSFAFATIMFSGVLLELISALILGLSKPVVFNALRGVLVYIIFCFMYYHYRD